MNRTHRISYLADALAILPNEVAFDFAPSFDAAMDKVSGALPSLQGKHGPLTGYKIFDATGRPVMIGPGRCPMDDERQSP